MTTKSMTGSMLFGTMMNDPLPSVSNGYQQLPMEYIMSKNNNNQGKNNSNSNQGANMTTATTTTATATTTTVTQGVPMKPAISHEQCKFFCLSMVSLTDDWGSKKSKDRKFDAERVQEIIGTVQVDPSHTAAGQAAVSSYKGYTPQVLQSMGDKAAFWLAVADQLILLGVNVPQEGQDAKTRAKSVSASIDYAKRVANRSDLSLRDRVVNFWARCGVDVETTNILVPEPDETLVVPTQVQQQTQVVGFGMPTQPQVQPVQAQATAQGSPTAFLEAKVAVLRSLGATNDQIIAAIAATSMA